MGRFLIGSAYIFVVVLIGLSTPLAVAAAAAGEDATAAASGEDATAAASGEDATAAASGDDATAAASGDDATATTFILRQQSAYSSDRRRPAMVLPLYPSPPNFSDKFHSESIRRYLQRSESDLNASRHNARMRLYDDLLLNGYYSTKLWIGTPPQSFALIVDTGSTVTYVPCSTCEQCGNHQDPKFQPDLSNTYQPVKCNVDCNCDNERELCTYERHYAEMSTSSGVLGEDVISFGDQSELVPQRAIFGCENVETGDLFSQHADGIMGLGRGELSIVDQLVDRGVISDSFSLCYGGMDMGGGAMVLGGISAPRGMVFTHSDTARSQYYNIELSELHVAGKRLPLNPKVFDGKHGTVLDSGTTYAYLPETAFMAFKDALTKELNSIKQIHGPDPNYNDICFPDAGSDVLGLAKTFPVVDMVFSNGQKLSLSPENYLFRHSKVHGAYCLGVFQNGRDPTTLLGGIIVRNTLVMYDREHEKIGFWKTNCSELWERLHIPDVNLVPPASNNNNSAETVASNESLQHDIPGMILKNTAGNSPCILIFFNEAAGELQVGFITFDVSLNIKFSDLKPRIPELAEIMAHDLDVNTSQLHLLDSTSEGNNSLVRWAIYPAEPAQFMSNATAMEIFAQLSEHRMQLPDNFGSYQLLEWKVQPLKKRTWRNRPYLAGIVGVIVTLVLVLSALGIWYVWRGRTLSLTSYKPVDAPVPEQELQLQPL